MQAVDVYASPAPRSLYQRDPSGEPQFLRPALVIVPAVDALALQGDGDPAVFAPPQAPLPPPPQGERFDVDADGLVRATPDGAYAPGGYLVKTGLPPVLSPPRPLRNADTEGTTRLAAADDPLRLSPPPPRPGDLAERWERAVWADAPKQNCNACARSRARPSAPPSPQHRWQPPKHRPQPSQRSSPRPPP